VSGEWTVISDESRPTIVVRARIGSSREGMCDVDFALAAGDNFTFLPVALCREVASSR